ncbi:MAG: hypothetical protein Q8K45_05990 [Rubrivivax sp.]|nr:hypothetical protein [Rubrivivax sp.]
MNAEAFPAAGPTLEHAAARSPIEALFERLHQRFAGNAGGQAATYIPELARADPAAIAIATADGRVSRWVACARPTCAPTARSNAAC